jgi:hypothetical protein
MNRAVGALPAILKRIGGEFLLRRKIEAAPRRVAEDFSSTACRACKTLVWLKGGELKAERMLWANSGNILVT